MNKWNENELINKAKHGKVWNDLLRRGKIQNHWPGPDVVEKVLRRLRSEGEHAAAERIESFLVPDRAELHGIIGYDS